MSRSVWEWDNSRIAAGEEPEPTRVDRIVLHLLRTFAVIYFAFQLMVLPIEEIERLVLGVALVVFAGLLYLYPANTVTRYFVKQLSAISSRKIVLETTELTYRKDKHFRCYALDRFTSSVKIEGAVNPVLTFGYRGRVVRIPLRGVPLTMQESLLDQLTRLCCASTHE